MSLSISNYEAEFVIKWLCLSVLTNIYWQVEIIKCSSCLALVNLVIVDNYYSINQSQRVKRCSVKTWLVTVLSFYFRDASQKLYLPKPRTDYTTWSVASVVAELLFETIFLRIFARQYLYATSREELINGSLYRTPTWQICNPVNRKFYLRWISSLFSIVIMIFLPCFK